MTCRPGWQVGLLGSALFAGWCATLLWLPSLADKYGRWKFYWWGNVYRFLIYSVLMLSKNFWLTVSMIFLLGTSESLAISIGFNYCNELLGKPYRPIFGSIWNVNEGCIYLWCTIYFGWVSKDWFPFFAVGWAIVFLTTIATYWLPESPCWLVNV